MKCFRVRDVGEVEDGLQYEVLDGIAYVSVGGLTRSYLSMEKSLTGANKSGSVLRASLRTQSEGAGLALVPESADPELAIIVIPSGGFDFDLTGVEVPHKPRNPQCALLVVLGPGQTVRARRKTRTLAEANNACPLALSYDGERVTFLQR